MWTVQNFLVYGGHDVATATSLARRVIGVENLTLNL